MKRLGWQLAELVVQYLDNEVAVPLYKYPEAAKAWEDYKLARAAGRSSAGRT